MNYIYDILLNFNEKYYDFYEWDENIIHVKKIPCIKINNEQMKIIYNNKVKLNLKNIFNKTEVFNNKNINYACILYCKEFAMAIKLDKNGIIKERSSLLFEDLEDVLDNNSNENTLEIEILEPIKYNLLIKEDDYLNNYILKEINKLVKNKEYSELKYIYYECFNIKELDIKKVINEINKIVKDDYINYGKKIYDILKLNVK